MTCAIHKHVNARDAQIYLYKYNILLQKALTFSEKGNKIQY